MKPSKYVSLSPQNFEDSSFEQWAMTLNKIYKHKNADRNPSDMWLRAVSDASKVGEAIRKMEADEAMNFIVHTFAWLITTSSKLMLTTYNNEPALLTFDEKSHRSLTDIVLAKYPGICPYCGGQSCQCSVARRSIEKESKEARRLRLLKVRQTLSVDSNLPNTIIGLSSMFEHIYGHVHYGVSLERITFHFLEEIGEVAWCITSLEEGVKRGNSNLKPLCIQLAEEIADVAAWGIAVVGKLANLAEQSNRLVTVLFPSSHLDQGERGNLQVNSVLIRWLWYKFYDPAQSLLVCPTCHGAVCEC